MLGKVRTWAGVLLAAALAIASPANAGGGQFCAGDVNGDNQVGILDFLEVLGSWGPCPVNQPCPADLDGDETVGVTDLLIVLENYKEACGLCTVVIDEDTIDNGTSMIEAAAMGHGVAPDFLINDDSPTEGPNPCLRWNDMFPGDTVLLPGGQVDDEGVFALPEETPWSLEDFVAGVVPQNQLDQIPDVMPLRSQDLFQLIGRTCVAVVYDSDISMNYQPLLANLQGARYGLFYFTVLGVVVPGSIPESGSSSSLYELLVRVEPCLDGAPLVGVDVVIRDHEPDSIQITQATWSSGTLTVFGVSNFAPGAVMTLSVEDFVLEAPMAFNASQGRYEAVIPTGVNLVGRRVSISTDEGGQNNTTIASPSPMSPQ